MMKVWECKVVLPDDVELPDGADFPMREAVRGAVEKMTGRFPSDIFSGWGGKLTDLQLEIMGIKNDPEYTPDLDNAHTEMCEGTEETCPATAHKKNA